MNKRSKKVKEKILNSFVSDEDIEKVIKEMENYMKNNEAKNNKEKIKEIK